jgi:hypothetical protein
LKVVLRIACVLNLEDSSRSLLNYMAVMLVHLSTKY